MSFLQRLFGGPTKQRTVLDDVQDVSGKLIVSGYRRIAAQRGCAPGPAISDAQIIQIYKTVGTAFQDAARARNEIVRAAILNNIVLFFLQKYQMFGIEQPRVFRATRRLRSQQVSNGWFARGISRAA